MVTLSFLLDLAWLQMSSRVLLHDFPLSVDEWVLSGHVSSSDRRKILPKLQGVFSGERDCKDLFNITHTHSIAHTHTEYHVVRDPFVPSLHPVCREIWVDVCGGSDPSQQTMWWLKSRFLLFSLRSLPVRCKFTWPFNSSPQKLLSFVCWRRWGT